MHKLNSVSPIWLWIINFGAAFFAVAWLIGDARFEASVDWWRYEKAIVTDVEAVRDMGDWWWLGFRNRTVVLVGATAVLSAAMMIAGLLLGSTKSRSLPAWLIAVSCIAVWLSVFMNWKDIAWLGKQYRLRGVLGEFSEVVTDLHCRWPQADGEREVIGPFMAYPISKPGTLILLTLPELESATSFAVIEGGHGKTIRFELVGAERGDWLEWHPAGEEPRDFVSGINEFYQLKRYQKLTKHWYLVRYRSFAESGRDRPFTYRERKKRPADLRFASQRAVVGHSM